MFGFSTRQSLYSLRTAAAATLLALAAVNAASASSLFHDRVPMTPLRHVVAHDTLGAKLPHANAAFTTLDNPGDPTFNQLLSIDNNGVIAGYFGSGMPGHPNQAYLIAPPYTSFMPDNVVASTQTQVQGRIAQGTASGFWAATNTGSDANFGFVQYEVGGLVEFLMVNNPATSSNPPVNQVLGVNASGHAVGFYNDSSVPSNSHAYVYSIGTGKYTPITISGTTSTQALGINANNIICGNYTNSAGHTKAFLFNLTSLASIHYSVSTSTNTQFLNVNDNGIAVGFYIGSDTFPHGIAYNSATGNVVVVNDPNGVQGTTLNGINDKGEIVGFYTDAAGNTHGMIVTGVSP